MHNKYTSSILNAKQRFGEIFYTVPGCPKYDKAVRAKYAAYYQGTDYFHSGGKFALEPDFSKNLIFYGV